MKIFQDENEKFQQEIEDLVRQLSVSSWINFQSSHPPLPSLYPSLSRGPVGDSTRISNLS